VVGEVLGVYEHFEPSGLQHALVRVTVWGRGRGPVNGVQGWG